MFLGIRLLRVQPRLEHGTDLIDVHRLAQMPIHTGTQGALDVFRKDAGGQCENGDAGGVFTGSARMVRAASRPSMIGICISMRIAAYSPSGTLKQVHGHLAVLGVTTLRFM
ncbi:MAG: hypothetical protein ACLR7Z_20230 [Bilophila wadsworthia]